MLFDGSQDAEVPGPLTKLAQNLVKRVIIDGDGNIVDFVLRIPVDENHIANLKWQTSPS